MPMLEDQECLKSTGVGEYKWDGDGWFLVGRGTMSMEPFGDVTAVETWMYDVHARKYRSTWVDTLGMMGMSEGTYDEKTKTWHLKATTFGAWGKSHSKWWMRFTDTDHMAWEWAEYHGLTKTMEMSGSGRRVK